MYVICNFNPDSDSPLVLMSYIEQYNEYMQEINKITGEDYKPFNYYGSKNATKVIVAMGSVCETVRETVEYLVEQKKENVGLVEVHLYRPFSTKFFLKALPKSVKKIAVLDRTKEAGSTGEPLYLDVIKTIKEVDAKVSVYGGRYGLSSKNTTPAMIKGVFDFLDTRDVHSNFTVGIIDDVRLDYANNDLLISYVLDADATDKMQEDSLAKAKEISDSIIKDGMSDYEKEIAINDYLCENAAYNDKILEAISDEGTIDDNVVYEYPNSFTPYGILCENVGVCESYAEAFLLIAQECGLEAIIETGKMQNVNHEWNRVKLDGGWYMLDVTNNDSDMIKNMYVNLPDDVASLYVQKSTEAYMDNVASEYTSEGMDYEYYNVNGLYSEDKTKAAKKRVLVDEAWMLLPYPEAVDFLNKMARRARKRNVSLAIISQRFQDFYEKQEVQAVLTSSDTKLFLAQDKSEIEYLKEVFKLSNRDVKLDVDSQYFHEDTCSAIFTNKDGAKSDTLTDSITFRDSDTGTRMDLNIGDAAYIFDTFLDLCPEAIDFFNKFIEYRNLKIVKV